MAGIVCVLPATFIPVFGILTMPTGLTWFDAMLGNGVMGMGVCGGKAPNPTVLP